MDLGAIIARVRNASEDPNDPPDHDCADWLVALIGRGAKIGWMCGRCPHSFLSPAAGAELLRKRASA